MNKLLSALVIFLALLMSKPLSADTSASQNVQDSPPVTRLKELLDSDDKFRENLMLALDQAAPLPQGQPNPWQGKSKQDLYDFLNEWFYFMPDKNNGLDRIVEFSLLYYWIGQNSRVFAAVLQKPLWTGLYQPRAWKKLGTGFCCTARQVPG